ncbi:hypothetical protein BDW02DRAFT_594988 [Decorospora gaudefroyi]|uniref:Uncharacterized protein n=1 Tax=Decorospora gaudefroyi TaxID=184978 RepID=A0A6A5KID6_9PLEO|nr:hypothetical protein BDW02DRAFT_594988 [Decorospora gaudefroyi]
MCHKLLQVYACGHAKTVCTTPCPHALATGQPIPQDSNEITCSELSRSSSVVSSLAPQTSTRRSDIHDLPSQRHARLSSLINTPSPPPPSAFHFVTVVGNENSTSNSNSQDNVSPSSPSPTAATLSPSPPPHLTAAAYFSPAGPERPSLTTGPNLCTYYFRHNLAASKVPCSACYARTEWEPYRRAWMRAYREAHPMGRSEDVEVLSGVKGV